MAQYFQSPKVQFSIAGQLDTYFSTGSIVGAQSFATVKDVELSHIPELDFLEQMNLRLSDLTVDFHDNPSVLTRETMFEGLSN